MLILGERVNGWFRRGLGRLGVGPRLRRSRKSKPVRPNSERAPPTTSTGDRDPCCWPEVLRSLRHERTLSQYLTRMVRSDGDEYSAFNRWLITLAADRSRRQAAVPDSARTGLDRTTSPLMCVTASRHSHGSRSHRDRSPPQPRRPYRPAAQRRPLTRARGGFGQADRARTAVTTPQWARTRVASTRHRRLPTCPRSRSAVSLIAARSRPFTDFFLLFAQQRNNEGRPKSTTTSADRGLLSRAELGVQRSRPPWFAVTAYSDGDRAVPGSKPASPMTQRAREKPEGALYSIGTTGYPREITLESCGFVARGAGTATPWCRSGRPCSELSVGPPLQRSN